MSEIKALEFKQLPPMAKNDDFNGSRFGIHGVMHVGSFNELGFPTGWLLVDGTMKLDMQGTDVFIHGERHAKFSEWRRLAMTGKFTCKLHAENNFPCCCNAAKGFAMMALSMMSAGTVNMEDAISQNDAFDVADMPLDQAEKLRVACRVGAVTTIQASHEPMRFLMASGGYGTARQPYGIWIGREASWRNTRPPIQPTAFIKVDDATVLPEGADSNDEPAGEEIVQ